MEVDEKIIRYVADLIRDVEGEIYGKQLTDKLEEYDKAMQLLINKKAIKILFEINP